MKGYLNIIKRGLDLVGAVVMLVLLVPVLLGVAVVVWLTMGLPVFFCQKRPGIGGKPFILYKFRTMMDTKDEQGRLLSDELRLTGVGKFLRRTSIDELPTLFNLLKGELSLVGPRPLLMSYLKLYTPEQARRHKVKPGLTGWAQVNGRNAIKWEEKFKLDVWYVDNQSLWLDLKILWRTLWLVLCCQGINQDGHATMEGFKGTISKYEESIKI